MLRNSKAVRAAMAEPEPMRWTWEDTKGVLVLAFVILSVLGLLFIKQMLF